MHCDARLLTRSSNLAIQEIETCELRADLELARDRFFCAYVGRVNPTCDPGNRAGFFMPAARRPPVVEARGKRRPFRPAAAARAFKTGRNIRQGRRMRGQSHPRTAGAPMSGLPEIGTMGREVPPTDLTPQSQTEKELI
jgi:hypothetical protein